MKVLFIILCLLVTFVSSDVYASLSCNSVFSDEGLRITDRLIPDDVELNAIRFEVDNRTNTITSKADPLFKSTLLDMLGMMTETVFITGDQKAINEKGELRLAVEYRDGQSIEFEYFGDKRGSETLYRLGKVSFIKANGKDITIEKNPVSDDGRQLQKSEIVIATQFDKSAISSNAVIKTTILEKSNIETWSEKSDETKKSISGIKKDQGLTEALRNISKNLSAEDAQIIDRLVADQRVFKVPVTISGPILQHMIKWSELLPVIKRNEVRKAIENRDTKGLLIKAQLKAHSQFAFRVGKKQLFKYVIIGSIFFGITNYNNISNQNANDKSNTTVLSDLLIAKSNFAKENVQIFSGIASSFCKEADPLFEQMLHSRTVEKMSSAETKMSTENVRQSIADLVEKEESHKGKSKFYIGDVNMKLTAFADKNANPALTSADYMIGLFEKQNKIAIVSIARSDLTSRIEMTEVIVDRKTYPELYEKIRENLKKIIEPSNK
jgi:hypothetical protein